MVSGTGITTFQDIYTAAMGWARQPTDNTTLLNRMKDAVNMKYEDVAVHKKWQWLMAEDAVSIIGVYTTGTVTVTQGSASVTGVSTTWTDDSIDTTYKFKVDGYDEIYDISTVGSNTSITLADTYKGDDATSVAYRIWKDVYELPNTVREVDQVWVDHRSFPARAVGMKKMRELKNLWPTDTDKVLAFTLIQDSSDGDRQLQIFPVPDEDYTLHYTYAKRITRLSDDEDEPLIPIGYRHVLVYGALEEWALQAGNPQLVTLYSSKYVDLLRRLAHDTEITDDFLTIKVDQPWRRKDRGFGRRIDYGDVFDRYGIPDY